MRSIRTIVKEAVLSGAEKVARAKWLARARQDALHKTSEAFEALREIAGPRMMAVNSTDELVRAKKQFNDLADKFLAGCEELAKARESDPDYLAVKKREAARSAAYRGEVAPHRMPWQK